MLPQKYHAHLKQCYSEKQESLRKETESLSKGNKSYTEDYMVCLQLKNVAKEIKDSMNGFNSRIETLEEGIWETEQ
jgi:hypothetical protein